MLDPVLLRKDLGAVLALLNTRKHPQPFLDEAAFSALEAERKTIQTRTEALQIFTRNGAISMGLGDVTGTLTVGKSADLAVLDRDIAAVPVPDIAGTTVTETHFAGRLVHRAG